MGCSLFYFYLTKAKTCRIFPQQILAIKLIPKRKKAAYRGFLMQSPT